MECWSNSLHLAVWCSTFLGMLVSLSSKGKFLVIHIAKYLAETEQGVAQAIIRSVVNFNRDPLPKVSDNAKDLVKRMLNPDPSKRLTAQEVLDHPWIQNTKKNPNVPLVKQ